MNEASNSSILCSSCGQRSTALAYDHDPMADRTKCGDCNASAARSRKIKELKITIEVFEHYTSLLPALKAELKKLEG